MKNTIATLYGFIAKLVGLLDDEIEELLIAKSRNNIDAKRNIADVANKLVNLITQLNKLNEGLKVRKNIMKEEDAAIIQEFLNKHTKK